MASYYIKLPSTSAGNVVGPGSSVDGDIATFSGTTGQLLADSGTKVTDLASKNSTEASRGVHIIEDFIAWQPVVATGTFFSGAGANGGGNTGAAGGVAQIDVNHLGVAPFDTGTSTNGAGAIFSAAVLTFGGGQSTLEWVMDPVALSDGTNTYTLVMGFCDQQTAGITDANSNGIYLRYTHGTNSGNIQLKTMATGVATTVNTTTAFATGWHKFKIVVAADASLVTAYMDGVSIGTSSTNIPNTIGQRIGIGFYITKSAGTGHSFMNLDYVQFDWVATTPR